MANKVLIIDDELLTGELLDTYLSMKGYHVVRAERGREGFMKAQTENPDLIVLDMMMPDLTGEEVCRMLRQATITANTPVIFLSALYSYDAQRRARDAGANQYLPKNTPLSELASHIKRIIAEREALSSAADSVIRPDTPTTPRP